jgi:cytochrome c oxidase subunit 2
MTGTVVVMGPSDFDAWKRGVGPREAIDASSPISLGRMVYVKYGCGRCHDDPASSRAPSLAGLFGQRVGLEGGGFVRADEQYLHDAVLLAPKYVVAGYTPVMPTYAGIVSEREATDLISYIETLRSPDVSLASLR